MDWYTHSIDIPGIKDDGGPCRGGHITSLSKKDILEYINRYIMLCSCMFLRSDRN